MVIEYLAESGMIPKLAAFLPEVLGGVALLYVVVEGSRTRFRLVRGVYWLVFGAIAIHVLFGIVANEVAPGPIFIGLRYLIRGVPLFLLAAVCNFTDRQVRTQLMFILGVSVLQFPTALWQKITLNAEGDAISGTLLNTAFLTPFLVCVACVMTGFYLRGKLKLGIFVLLLLMVLAPTAINETKVTVFLLPLGVVSVFILGSAPGLRLRNAIIATSLSVVLLGAFVPVYNYTQKDVEGSFDLLGFFTDPGKAENYLETDASLGNARDVTHVGRLDGIAVPFRYIIQEPVTMWFGLGLGNSSLSPIGAQFQGEYARLFELFLGTTVSRLLLETGVGGLAFSLLLMFLIFKDTRVVADQDEGFLGPLAAGWIGVSVVMVLTIFYADTIVSSSFAFLYWHFSGILSAQRMRLALGVDSPIERARLADRVSPAKSLGMARGST